MLTPIVKKLLPKHPAREAMSLATPAAVTTRPRATRKPTAPVFPTFPSSSTIFSLASSGSEVSLLYPEAVSKVIADASSLQQPQSIAQRPGARRACTTPHLPKEPTTVTLQVSLSAPGQENLRPTCARHSTLESVRALHDRPPLRCLNKSEINKQIRPSPAHQVQLINVFAIDGTATEAPCSSSEAPSPATTQRIADHPAAVCVRPHSSADYPRSLSQEPLPVECIEAISPAVVPTTHPSARLNVVAPARSGPQPSSAPRPPSKPTDQHLLPQSDLPSARSIGSLSRSGAVYRGRRGRSTTPTTLDWAATALSPSSVSAERSTKPSTGAFPASPSHVQSSRELHPQTLVTAVSVSFLSFGRESYSERDARFERSITNAMGNLGTWATMEG